MLHFSMEIIADDATEYAALKVKMDLAVASESNPINDYDTVDAELKVITEFDAPIEE